MRIIILFIFSFLILNIHAQLYIPVPDEVKGTDVAEISLNGTWQFNPVPATDFWKHKPKDWSSIDVPGEWVMQGFNVEARQSAGYFRTFIIPNSWKEKEIILRCDAIYSDAIIWINGQEVGRHMGGFNAFEFNITDYVEAGKENNISIGVMSESFNDTLSSATQYAAHQLGGITRKIYLFTVPEVFISDLKVETVFDKNYQDAELNIRCRIQNNSEKKHTQGILTYYLTSPEGSSEKLAENEFFNPDGLIEMVFNIPGPEKWSAESPNLYTLSAELKSSRNIEILSQKIGFRQIEIVGNQLYLNGKPIKLKGVNRHEVHPLRGRSLTDELWKKDALLFKEANCNYIRTSHYPPAEEFIGYCDSIGLFVELEAPFCWAGHGANIKFKNRESLPDTLGKIFQSSVSETIEFYKNNPSVIIWSMANESAWTKQWEEVFDSIKILDPTRPISFHDQSWGTWNNYASTTDIANIHYPGPNGPERAKKFQRPLLFGEYTHLNTYNRKEIATDPGVRDAWGRGFEAMWDNMYYSTGCLGGAVWSGVDDVFYLPDGRAVGYGEWGPIDGWRRKKPEYWHMKKTYSPVKVYNKNVKVPVNENLIRLQIENRFDFTNLKSCSILWEIGHEEGILKPDIAPRSFGFAEIVPDEKVLDGRIINLKVLDPYDRIVDEYNIRIGDEEAPEFPGECISFNDLSLDVSDTDIKISSEAFEWIFNRKTGMIKTVKIDGEEVLVVGGTLMMLPLKTGPCKTEHSLEVNVMNDPCKGWQSDSIDAVETDDGIKVHIKGSYNEADGSLTYLFKSNGEVMVDYNFVTKIAIDPRQTGLVYTCSKEYNRLSWEREGQWTAYPDDHIGRTTGETLYTEENTYDFIFGKEPEWEWMFDNNFLGTNDFRSAKDYIYWASLRNSNGNGLVVISDGDDSFRAFADNENISFLVAGFVTGGSDLFYASHLKNERRKLNVGDAFTGSFTIRFVK